MQTQVVKMNGLATIQVNTVRKHFPGTSGLPAEQWERNPTLELNAREWFQLWEHIRILQRLLIHSDTLEVSKGLARHVEVKQGGVNYVL